MIWVMIYPEAKYSPAVNLWNQTSYVLPKCNCGTGMGEIFPFPKGRNRKEERSDRSQASPKPNWANSIRPEDSVIILFGSMLCILDPLGYQYIPIAWWGATHTVTLCQSLIQFLALLTVTYVVVLLGGPHPTLWDTRWELPDPPVPERWPHPLK